MEKEDAAFETEISEEDIPGEWKLKGEVLTRSPVRPECSVFTKCHEVVMDYLCIFMLSTITSKSVSDMRHPDGGCSASADPEELPAGPGG